MEKVKVKFALIVLAICFLLGSTARAATINAGSCSQSIVETAIASASAGDTVTIPPGSCTWSLRITVSKRLNIIGGGKGSTNIDCSGGPCFESSANGVRISGFSFSNCDQCVHIWGTGWRIDHCGFTRTSHGLGVSATGQVDNIVPSGVIDNCSFNYTSVVAVGTAAMLGEGNYQHNIWAQDPGFGTNSGVYVEDSSFANGINSMDCNYSGRIIHRFNTYNNTYLEAHSVQGGNRACQRWEIYNNTINNPTWVSMFIRGGSGFIFNNTVNDAGKGGIALNNVRTCESRDSAGQCNGSSNWDQNTPGQHGWGCRDQIGRSYDTVEWAPGRPYAQPLTPVYIWNNTVTPGGSQNDPHIHDAYGCSEVAYHIMNDRDYYKYNASFNGTSGVGVGTLASRPANCTAGVAYWATDQGSWNKSGKAGQGVLYKCTSTNTWALYYTPYTYPHPLQGGGGGLQPPQNLRIVQ